jgi:dTMP kinase
MFVTFEGIEGSGKSTQIARLAARLTEAGRPPLVTREPGGTPLADAIRALFLRPDPDPMPAAAELFLVLASRASHVRDVVRPALAEGRLVLCDRYADATFTYQGAGRGLDLDLLRRANALATGGLVPDWTVLVDLPVEAGLARVRRRNVTAQAAAEGRLDDEKVEFHQRVRRGYLELAREQPERFTTFDGELPVERLTEEIVAEGRRRGIEGI